MTHEDRFGERMIAVILAFVLSLVSFSCGERHGKDVEQNDAVKAGAARWVPASDGSAKIEYLRCDHE